MIQWCRSLALPLMAFLSVSAVEVGFEALPDPAVLLEGEPLRTVAVELTRSGDHSAPLTVSMAVGGTVDDSDYVLKTVPASAWSATTDTITFPVGTSSVQCVFAVDVTNAFDDGEAEEQLLFSVVDTAAYTLGALSTVSVRMLADGLLPPTVAIAAPAAASKSAALDFTVTFSEAVSGFSTDDCVLHNAELADPAMVDQGAGVYTVTAIPTEPGEVGLAIIPDAATAVATTLPSRPGVMELLVYDPVAPVAEWVLPAEPIYAGTFVVEIHFDEAVLGFTASDLMVSGAVVEGIEDIEGSEQDYLITLSGPAGLVQIDLLANALADNAGNGNQADQVELTLITDPPPTVTLRLPGAAPLAGEFSVAIDFSEDVTGFTLADIQVSGGTPLALSGGDARYTLRLSAVAGTVEIAVPAAVAVDAIGQNNSAATPLIVEVAVDTQPPQMSARIEISGEVADDVKSLHALYPDLSFERVLLVPTGQGYQRWYHTVTVPSAGVLSFELVAIDAAGNRESYVITIGPGAGA